MRSVRRVPKPPVMSFGSSFFTSCARSASAAEWMSARAPVKDRRPAMSSADRFASSGSATAPAKRHAAWTVIHS